MKFSIPTADGQSYEAYAYTGGKAFDAKKPTVVFIPVSYTHLTLPTIYSV